jgi:NAD(P)-dependent dehydrogenase (short-subunit alcohol dehydrogenase family)
MDLQPGRVAVITGGASGIGFALAAAAADAGLDIVVVDINGDRLEPAAATLRERGVAVDAMTGDISDATFVGEVAATAFARGRVQLVCSNAGIVVPGRVWETSNAEWERVLAVNFMATVYLFGAFIPRLIAAGEPAQLLITGSMASVTARPGIGPYVAAKHALLGLAEVTSHELTAAQVPIGVTLLMPGQVVTGMTADTPAPPGAITPEQAAGRAFEAIARDQLFVFTQADRVPEVRDRFTAIVEGRTPRAPG